MKETKQFDLSKKELISLNRYDYRIQDIKKEMFKVKVNEKTSIPVYFSDYSNDSKKNESNSMNIPLTQLMTSKSLEHFNIEQISSLFNSLKMQSHQDMSIHNSMVMFNNTNMDNLMQNPIFNKKQKTNTSMLAEHSMFTTMYVDEET